MSAATEIPQNRAGDSTSPGLSSPPSANSPTHQTATPEDFAQSYAASPSRTASHTNTLDHGGVKLEKAIAANSISASKRPRKKRDADNHFGSASAAAATHAPEPKPRKRAPRGTSAAFLKKKAKLEEEAAARKAEALQLPLQTKLTDSISAPSFPPTKTDVFPTHPPPQNGNNEAIPTPLTYTPNIAPQPRPISGQNYDPIRSSTVAPRPTSPMNTLSTPTKTTKYSSASASPSISSLIDPPDPMRPYSFHQHPYHERDIKPPSPPEPKRPRLSPPALLPAQQVFTSSTPNEVGPPTNGVPNEIPAVAMDIDTEATAAASSKTTMIPKKPTPNPSTTISSSSHSPKPPRAKEAPVSLPTGSGLLSGSIFGTGGLDSVGPEKTAPTVILNVPLTGDNQYVNFTRLAEERYGFNALHPRLAAQRDRLARVAAAGAALENAHKNGQSGSGMSADEMSVDLSNDEGDNSNAEMGGLNEGERILGVRSGEDAGEMVTVKKPKKRIMKEDMYDKDDDFVDDAELAWEEQAAVTKDGFFVYSGLLVPEGEEAKVERADGPPKRGRGGGRGSRGGGLTRGGSRTAANKDASKDGKAPGRKRTTKATKELMEREKAQRENLVVLASKPANYPAPPQLTV